ncbi:MAG: MoxR family ATPase, partial [Chloroflexota bacterium]
AIHRPVTLITSNAEKELPDAFLRRCVFHYIEFPTPELMEEIVRVHFPDIKNSLLKEAIKTFYSLRKVEEFRKKPSTSELIDWLRILIASEAPHDSISREIPYAGTLLKKESDYDYFKNQILRNGNPLMRRL